MLETMLPLRYGHMVHPDWRQEATIAIGQLWRLAIAWRFISLREKRTSCFWKGRLQVWQKKGEFAGLSAKRAPLVVSPSDIWTNEQRHRGKTKSHHLLHGRMFRFLCLFSGKHIHERGRGSLFFRLLARTPYVHFFFLRTTFFGSAWLVLKFLAIFRLKV